MTAKTLSDAVRQVLEDAFPEYRADWGNTNTRIAQDFVLKKLMPLLSLLDEMHAVTDGCGYAVSLSADYRKARAALMGEGE